MATSSSRLRPQLDLVDLEILDHLGREPRMPMSELGRRIGMSAPASRERVRRLEDLGVIRGFRLVVDPVAIGLPVTALVRVRPAPGQLSLVAELAHSTAEVVECHRITGEDCFLLKVHAVGMEALEELLDRLLEHGQTTTSIVQSSPVEGRPAPLEQARRGIAPRRRRKGP